MDIDKGKVAQKYNALDEIWKSTDKWHKRTYAVLKKFISSKIALLNCVQGTILNAGSAGNSYGLPEDKMIHLDIANEKIAHLKNAVCGSIENLPFGSNEFDLIICIGSVINYNDPLKVFGEFNRVLKSNGHLVVEFENSNTLELIFTRKFNKKAVFVNTFYYGKEPLWYYSDKWLREISKHHGMRIVDKFKFHFLSPFIYRFTKDENTAGKYIWFDRLFRILPVLKNISSNTILVMQKAQTI